MTVYLVGAGPGDPGLLTVRGAEVLRRAEIVVYDRLSVASLLDLAPAAATRISVGKTPRGPSTPQEEINALLVECGRDGKTVVRLKGGDPFVFARGGEEAAALAAAGVPFEIVPGISSAIAVPAYAGVPLTQRGYSTSFTVVTGHEDPWAATETDWDAVARVGGTIVVLMGVATRAEIARRLIEGGLSAETPVAAVQWGTRPDQRSVRTTLASLGEVDVDSPAVLVIGAVAALDLAWFERRPLFGRKVVVTRSREQASELRSRLEASGAAVLEVPTIRIEPAAGDVDLAAGVRGAAWVVLTSANAAALVCGSLHDARGFGGAKVAAIGPGTAAVLERFGVRPDLVPDRNVGEGLVEAFPQGSGRVFLPQAADARKVVAEGLRAKGWTVDGVTAYTTTPAELPPAVVEQVRTADAITFTSSSTVKHFVASGGVCPPVVVCIGPVTAETASALGLRVTAIADPHTIEGLVAALVGNQSPRS